jgi:hypothetical protein
MKSIFRSLALALMCVAAVGCTRIETGEVGLRRNFDKTFNMQELQPGTLNQTLIGDVVTFKVQEVAAVVSDLHPQAADNSALADFDAQVIYSLNPAAVAELWTKESRSFHAIDSHGQVLLMNGYISTLLRNASTKAVREHKSLVIGDNRSVIEAKIKSGIEEALQSRGLEKSIVISQVQVTNALPAASILKSANDLVNAENELKQKAVEVQTAAKEAERQTLLSSNKQNIEYMNAQSLNLIAQGVKEGKVHAVVVPYDFKGIVNTGK